MIAIRRRAYGFSFIAVACLLATVAFAEQSNTRLIVEFARTANTRSTSARTVATRATATASLTGIRSVDLLCARYGFTQKRALLREPPKNLALAESLGLTRTYLLISPTPVDMNAAVKAFAANPAIVYAEPDVIGHLMWTPDDPYFGEQYAYENTGQTGGVPGADINALEGWNYEQGDPSVIIAVIDTGIDYYHPDLADKIVEGIDLVNGGDFPLDDFGHGTHTAGIAAAITNNATGVAGTAPGCSIMPIKVVDWLGEGEAYTCADGIIWAADHGADVISISLGYSTGTRILGEAVDYAYAQDVVLCASIGNDGNPISYYPAAFPNCMGIGAMDDYGDLAYFSSYGSNLDCLAPGVAIYSTMCTYEDFLLGYMGYSMDYEYLDGTSMSCPMVAGLCALIRSANPSLTNVQVQNLVKSTCRDLGPPGWDDLTGWGCIDMGRALEQATRVTTTAPTGFINPLWNWISFPITPVNADPASIFGLANVQNQLYRWDPLIKTVEIYPSDFGTVECGTGYTLLAWSDLSPSYAGHPNAPDFEISIPMAGWTWIGFPRQTPLPLASVTVRKGIVTRTAAQDNAAPDPWLNWNLLYWDSTADTARICTLGVGGDDTQLRPWYGYRVWSGTENVTLIVP